jgi:hypothetical protein
MDTRNQHYMLPYLILQVINIGRFKLLVCPKYKQIKLLQVYMYVYVFLQHYIIYTSSVEIKQA